jgi:hypothetical protein
MNTPADKVRDAADVIEELAAAIHWVRLAIQLEVDADRCDSKFKDMLFDLRSDAQACFGEIEQLAADLEEFEDEDEATDEVRITDVLDPELRAQFLQWVREHPKEARAVARELLRKTDR